MLGKGTRGHKPGRAGSGFLIGESTTRNDTLISWGWNSSRKTKHTPKVEQNKMFITDSVFDCLLVFRVINDYRMG